MSIFWAVLGIVLAIVYVVTYILLRTSGDGRRALERLRHPSRGGLQEEYGGRGVPESRERQRRKLGRARRRDGR